MVIGARWGYMVGSFLGEDLSEVGIFQWEGDFGFSLFSSDGKFHCHGKFGNEWGVWEKLFTIALKDSVDLAIVQRMLEVLILCIMVGVFIESEVIDSVYVDVAVGSGKRFPEEGIVLLGVCGMGRV